MRTLASMLVALCAVAHAQETQYSGHGADSVAKEVVAKFAPPPLDPGEALAPIANLALSSYGQGHPVL